MKLHVDLNADLGEGAGHDSEILRHVTSASVACGAHAGEQAQILDVLRAAHAGGIAVGAHPGLADREGFGRRELPTSPTEASALVADQLTTFAELAARVDVKPRHVKLHGALYNMAARDATLADAVARSIAAFDGSLIVFAPGGSELARAALSAGLKVGREVFADRNYLADGTLVPRSRPNALLHDAIAAAERVVRMLREGFVRSVDGVDVAIEADTVCVHGDSPAAVAFARTLHRRLVEAGVALLPACSW